ncbi:homeobox-containing protein 1-like [Lineus longissimus]|uniref:homeobox-containing protein 1-like n=1 Tax=Lineus longissimus TaxID=88925 RepID=UPI002B4C6490
MKMNTSSMATNQPLFTVEQIDLLRRLRNSGMTKEQIIHGFDGLERLDREFGMTYNVPASLQSHMNGTDCNGSNHATNGLNSIDLTDEKISLSTSMASTLGLQRTHSTGMMSASNGLGSSHAGSFSQQAVFPTNMQTTPPRKRSFDLAFENGDGASNGSFCYDEDTEEFQVELQNLIKKGDAQIYEDVKEFVTQNSIKQHQVATFCGLSQSYVSRYLRGEYQDISDRSKRAIYRWFLIVKKNPSALAMTTNCLFANSKLKMLQTQNSCTAEQDYANSQRRERFVFRQAHLEVLEKHFKEDNYPSFEKRDEIARECNQVFVVPGKIMSEREKVNVHTVTNWFANKRKELKKIAREEGLDNIVSQMRGRGRPCLASTMQIKTEPKEPSSCREMVQTRQSKLAMEEEDVGTYDADDQLSLAVEVAAVNQAILALSGQQQPEARNLNIKEESDSS